MNLLRTGPADAEAAIMLAHGAGAPMDSGFMEQISAALAERNLQVIRFEFAYMAARRDGARKPPPRGDRLLGEYQSAVEAAGAGLPLVIGGKSLGGRVASMVADELFRAGAIRGLVCLGYPFHPPAKPDVLRTAHLETLSAPTVIFQGTRDPFGGRDEVPGYDLSDAIDIHWLEDGDHDLKPRKASGFTHAQHLDAVADRISSLAASG